MPRDFDDDYEITAKQADGLVEELELNQAIDIRDVRARAKTHITGQVVVRPANYRERGTVAGAGKAREIQGQSITCVLDQPLLVGDLFYVTLESADFDFTPSLAVCERSQLLANKKAPFALASLRFRMSTEASVN